jgi:hypothetical protein
MASNIYQRYFWLINTIYRYKRITFKDINRLWLKTGFSDGVEIPRKTFNNHRNTIEEIFEINIECNRKTNEYFIANAEEIRHGMFRSWLLDSFAINQTLNESKQLKSRILFEQIPSGNKYLLPIIEAMKNNNVLRVSYQRFDDDDSYEIDLEPYALKVFKQRWYVVGKTDRVKIYGLDRIEYLEETQTTFKLPTDFDAETYFADCYGIIHDETIKAGTVCLRFEVRQAQYIRSLPLHHTQQEIAKTDKTIDFEYFLKPTYDFIQEVLRYGEFVEVVKPEWLRVEFEQKIEKMRIKYKKK